MNLLTHFGSSEFLPDEATLHNQRIQHISQYFEGAGFVPVRTATIEKFDALAPGMDATLIGQSIRFFNRSGELMILRPDHTTPIARIIASRLKDHSEESKLYYVSPIFRHSTTGDAPTELFQAGAEWIGTSAPKSDAQLLLHCVKLLNILGFHDLGIDIGHPAFAHGLTPDETHALIQNDYVRFGRLPARGAIEVASHIPELVKLHHELVDLGISELVRYNTGLIREFEYYTGPHFEVYSNGLRQMVACGGRYDNLISKFGHNCPAVGFAINLSLIQESYAQC